MIEFIPDLREVERVPGLDIPARLSDHPIPGFKDAMGNFVGEGDWVATGASSKYRNQLRFARVLEVIPYATKVHDHWRMKPEEEWTEWDHEYVQRYARGPEDMPKESIRRDVTSAKVRILQYFDLRPDSWSRRQIKDASRVVRYTGEVPYLR